MQFTQWREILLSEKPSLQLQALADNSQLNDVPELRDLIGCAQNPDHHPEGDAWVHTLLVVDNAARALSKLQEHEKVPFMFHALLHDIGKPSTTKEVEGKGLVAYGHDKEGAKMAQAFLERVGAPKEFIDLVVPMVGCHMQLHTMAADAKEKSWRKLADKFPLRMGGWFARCDTFAGKRREEDMFEAEHRGSALLWEWAEKLEKPAEPKPKAFVADRYADFIKGLNMPSLINEALDAAHQEGKAGRDEGAEARSAITATELRNRVAGLEKLVKDHQGQREELVETDEFRRKVLDDLSNILKLVSKS